MPSNSHWLLFLSLVLQTWAATLYWTSRPTSLPSSKLLSSKTMQALTETHKCISTTHTPSKRIAVKMKSSAIVAAATSPTGTKKQWHARSSKSGASRLRCLLLKCNNNKPSLTTSVTTRNSLSLIALTHSSSSRFKCWTSPEARAQRLPKISHPDFKNLNSKCSSSWTMLIRCKCVTKWKVVFLMRSLIWKAKVSLASPSTTRSKRFLRVKSSSRSRKSCAATSRASRLKTKSRWPRFGTP